MSAFPYLPDYLIEEQLGEGGMATVYRAIQQNLNRSVAIKILDPSLLKKNKTAADRFLKEGQTAAQLSHTNIISIYNVGNVGKYHFIVMEYLEESLKDRMRNNPSGKIPVEEAFDLLEKLAPAMDYAHSKGIIHRDIKPDNIMFREDGTPVLVDFGIARVLDANQHMTKTGMSIGTPHYMSPEQCKAEAIDGRSDFYSLGVVLHEMLTGFKPFIADTSVGVALKHLQEPIPALSGELEQYQALLDKMMAKHRDDRVKNGEELIMLIEEIRKPLQLEEPLMLNGKQLQNDPFISPEPGMNTTQLSPIVTIPDTAPEPPAPEETRATSTSQPPQPPQTPPPPQMQPAQPELLQPQPVQPEIREPESHEPEIQKTKTPEPQITKPEAPPSKTPENLSTPPRVSKKTGKVKDIESKTEEFLRKSLGVPQTKPLTLWQKALLPALAVLTISIFFFFLYQGIKGGGSDSGSEPQKKVQAPTPKGQPQIIPEKKPEPPVKIDDLSEEKETDFNRYLEAAREYYKRKNFAEAGEAIAAARQIKTTPELETLAQDIEAQREKKNKVPVKTARRHKATGKSSPVAATDSAAGNAADNAAFGEAARVNTAAAFRAYLENFPDGKHINTAIAKIEGLEELERAKNQTKTVKQTHFLRRNFTTLVYEDAEAMIKKHGFYDEGFNKNGSYAGHLKAQTINGALVVTDARSRLMWHQGGSPKGMKFKSVGKWLRNLNHQKYAGFNDWRLPTLEEAASLIRRQKNPYGLHTHSYFAPKQKHIWTGDRFGGNKQWVIRFAKGLVFNYSTNSKHFLRPVRSMKK